MPRWKRVTTMDITFSSGLAAFPWRSATIACNDDDQDFDVVVPCTSDTTRRSEGLGVDLSALSTLWLLDRPRLAVEAGVETRLDLLARGASIFYDEDDTVPFAWTFRPAGGLLAGVRTAPRPASLAHGGDGTPWGANRPDGTARLARTQGGLRTGLLVGPGYNGLEASALGELWVARSIRQSRGPHATFTPYHPGTFLGPFVRGQLAFLPFGPADTRHLEVVTTRTLFVGVRGHVTLQKKPALPEAKSGT